MVSKGKPYWIDFGMIGHISENTMNVLQNAIFALLEKDSEALVNAVVSLGASTEKTDRSKLAEDLEMYIDKYMTVRSVSDIDMTELLGDLMDVCERNHIKMPAELTMLVRAIVTIEGVIEELCPELNLFEILSKKVMERATRGEDMRQKLISVGQDAISSARKVIKIPDLTYGALNGLMKGRTKIKVEMTGTEEIEDKASDSIKNIILAMFACFMFLGSCILCTTDIEPKLSESTPPLVAVAGFIFSVALGVYTVRRMRKKK
jgi:ubiquinone biosynthesis protein